jgi:hypothetical protein
MEMEQGAFIPSCQVISMFDIGAAGYTIVAVSATAGLGVVGFLLVVYAAHCFLTVVIDSGCGIDEVRWPGEGVFDWMLKPVYCGWLLFCWAVVFGVILLPMLLRDPLIFGVALAVVLYVVFPITLLSSLSAKSWVALVHPPLLRRLARWPTSYVTVLLLGLPLFGGVAILVGLTAAHSLWWVFLAALLLPALGLWYARLLGRYAWLVTHTPLKKKKRRTDAAPAAGAKPDRIGVKVEDPWAVKAPAPVKTAAERAAEESTVRNKYLPPEALERLDDDPPPPAEDEWTKDKQPYGVMGDAQARQSWQPRNVDPLGDAEGYDVGDAAQALAAPFSLTAYYDNYLAEEAKRRERTEPTPPPRPTYALAFGRGLFLFPFYAANVKPWVNLALILLLWLFFLRMLVIAGSVMFG